MSRLPWLLLLAAITVSAVATLLSSAPMVTAQDDAPEPQVSPTPSAGDDVVGALADTPNAVYLPLIAVEEGAQTETGVQTIDDLFAEVARQVPGFGGLFYDESGQLTMHLMESRSDEQMTLAAASTKAALTALLQNDPRMTEAGEIRVIPGQYDFLQLKEWSDRMNAAILGVPGVLLTDIDERANRLRIGIQDQAVQSVVQEHLAQLGIPREAVIIEVTEPIKAATTLRDKQPTLVGGLQIQYGSKGCTLGFIANRSGVKGIVTNSHCTSIQGGVENTVYYHPSGSGSTNRIGIETVDPPYSPGTGGVCPSGRRCRYSDTAFVKIPHPSGPSVKANVGFIARTTGLGKVDIDSNNPQYRIVREVAFPLVGEVLNKVGRTTGWTQGVVSATCYNIPVLDPNSAPTDITLICQDSVNAGQAGGDSGSPVFKFTNSSVVNVSATTGWQQTSLSLQQGKQFIIAYMSGTWTVDSRNFPYVAAEGYSSDTDQQIWQGCKVNSSAPYARLLGRAGSSGQIFSIGRGGTFTADASGPLYLRINDQDRCLGDNAGSVSMTVSPAAQSTGDVYLYGIMWGGSSTLFSFSAMSNMEVPSAELGALQTCASGFSC